MMKFEARKYGRNIFSAKKNRDARKYVYLLYIIFYDHTINSFRAKARTNCLHSFFQISMKFGYSAGWISWGSGFMSHYVYENGNIFALFLRHVPKRPEMTRMCA